jgi:DNA-binding MarR family transcriptional regulator
MRKLQRQHWMTAQQVADATGIQPDRASALLRRLWEDGEVQRQPGQTAMQYRRVR